MALHASLNAASDEVIPEDMEGKFEGVTLLQHVAAWHAVRKEGKILIDGMVVNNHKALAALLEIPLKNLCGKLANMGFTPHVPNPYKWKKYKSDEEPVIFTHKTFRPDSNPLDFSTTYKKKEAKEAN